MRISFLVSVFVLVGCGSAEVPNVEELSMEQDQYMIVDANGVAVTVADLGGDSEELVVLETEPTNGFGLAGVSANVTPKKAAVTVPTAVKKVNTPTPKTVPLCETVPAGTLCLRISTPTPTPTPQPTAKPKVVIPVTWYDSRGIAHIGSAVVINPRIPVLPMNPDLMPNIAPPALPARR